jgi:copper chaperone NosL
MPKLLRIVLLAAMLLSSCGSGEIRPVDIDAGDMCSFCRMAISEKQFAAEIIETGGEVHKFDDIGCMLRYKEAAGDKLDPAATFVTDHGSKTWIRAEDAFFVRSTSIKTPMASGIAAYSSAKEPGAEVLRFEELAVK